MAFFPEVEKLSLYGSMKDPIAILSQKNSSGDAQTPELKLVSELWQQSCFTLTSRHIDQWYRKEDQAANCRHQVFYKGVKKTNFGKKTAFKTSDYGKWGICVGKN